MTKRVQGGSFNPEEIHCCLAPGTVIFRINFRISFREHTVAVHMTFLYKRIVENSIGLLAFYDLLLEFVGVRLASKNSLF